MSDRMLAEQNHLRREQCPEVLVIDRLVIASHIKMMN